MEEVGLTTLRAGIISPYNAVIQYQQWASALAYSTTSPPKTRVSADYMDITYGTATLNIPTWRQGLKDMSEELEKELDELCYGSDYGLQLPDNIEDNWTEEDYGYSWLEKSSSFVSDEWGLLQRMLSDSSLALATITPGGTFIWNRLALSKFLLRSNMFMWKLGFFGFATNGQVPRVAEYVEHKIRNSHRPRTIFCSGSDIWMTIRRSKYENLVKSSDFRPIKCHPLFTSLLQRYLLLVRPLEVIFGSVLYGPSIAQDYRQFLFMNLGQRLDSDRYLQFIQSTTQKYFKAEIGAREYRQLTVEIARVFIGSEFDIDSDDMAILALQRGHSLSTARRHYAPEDNHLPSMSSDRLLEFGHVSEAWWEVTGFRPGYPPLLPLRQRLQHHSSIPPSHPYSSPPTNTSSDMLAQVLSSIKHMEANISHQMQSLQLGFTKEIQKVVAEAMAIQSMDQSNSTFPKQFLSTSTTVPDPLGSHTISRQPSSELSYASPLIQPMEVDYSPGSITLTKEVFQGLSRRVRSMMPPTGGPIWATSYNASPNEDQFLKQCLQQHFPHISTPDFRSPTQALAVALAIQGSASFVAHLPTGMGKSLTYQIPSRICADETNIVVIPNAFLLRDQVLKAKAMGLKAIHWNASMPFPPPSKANLVFMALESVVSKTFQEYAYFAWYYMIANIKFGPVLLKRTRTSSRDFMLMKPIKCLPQQIIGPNSKI